MAVMHYQFEAIHPFHDGNGRTGRILNILLLVQQSLLNTPVLYLSRYIIEHKERYYQLLQDVTERQSWEPWVIYMLRIQFLQEAGVAKRQTASQYLRELESIGLLRGVRVGREVYEQLVDLLAL